MYVYTLPGVDKAQVIEALENEADRLRRMAARPHTNTIAATMYNQLAGTLEQLAKELVQTLAVVLVSTREDQVSLFGDAPLVGREDVRRLRCNKCGEKWVQFGAAPGVTYHHNGCGGEYVRETSVSGRTY